MHLELIGDFDWWVDTGISEKLQKNQRLIAGF